MYIRYLAGLRGALALEIFEYAGAMPDDGTGKCILKADLDPLGLNYLSIIPSNSKKFFTLWVLEPIALCP